MAGKAKLLVISPESILPPVHGGSLRSANLVCELARHFETTVIVPQSTDAIQDGLQRDERFLRLRWLSAYSGSWAARVQGRLLLRKWAESQSRRSWQMLDYGWFFGPLLTWLPAIKAAYPHRGPDIVMVEHTRHAETLPVVARQWKTVLRVVNSQNVESTLVNQTLPANLGESLRELTVKRICRFERSLGQYADVLWCCSAHDLAMYRKLGAQCGDERVVPNGIDTNAHSYRTDDSDSRLELLFTGTLAYGPNVDGILWFFEKVWPLVTARLPAIRWTIVGRWPVKEIADLPRRDERIAVFGNVPSVIPFARSARLAICPLLAGSGTRLKILEAFSLGLTVISTSIGAQGIDVQNGGNIVLADSPDEFATAVVRLASSAGEREVIRKAARTLVEAKYDWSKIADGAADDLKGILSRRRSRSYP